MFVINSDWKSARGQVYQHWPRQTSTSNEFQRSTMAAVIQRPLHGSRFPTFCRCLPRQTVLSNCKNTFRCSFFSTCMTLTISPKEKIVTNKDMAWKKEKRGRKKLRWTRRVGLEWLYLCVVHRSDGPMEVRTCISIKMCIIKRQTSYS